MKTVLIAIAVIAAIYILYRLGRKLLDKALDRIMRY